VTADPPAGYFVDADGRRRWWDGSAWLDREPNAVAVRRGPSDEERREVLDRAVATYARHGYTVRSRSAFRAVVAKRQRVHLWMNLALVLVTGGFWLLVLAIRLLNWPLDSVVLVVDDHGSVIPEFSS
jgi:hypothetical protein